MRVSLSYNEKKHFLLLKATGAYSSADFVKYIPIVSDHAVKYNCNMILIDLFGMTGILQDWERFKTGQLVADKWSYKIKAAVYTKQDTINGFTENVAFNRGAKLKVFSDKETAIAWLKSDSE